MRYSKDHKKKTRQKILETAGKLIKKQGVKNTSIDQIMGEAGLTRGGFYAHFKSKNQLVSEMLKLNTGLMRMLMEREGDEDDELVAETIRIFTTYLNPENRKKVGTGCTLATMPLESARGNKAVRKAYTRRFETILNEIEKGLSGNKDSKSRALTTAVLAIGGVILSRATDNSNISDEIEKICLKEIKSQLTG